MSKAIPTIMKAIYQNEANGKLFVKEVPVPVPQKGEVLIKMAASPINPSDLSFLQGTYVGTPVYPVIPGIEGSGTVVASGGGLIANLRNGKRVTCTATSGRGGTWSEYIVTSAMRCIPISNSVSFDQGAMMIVNPLTVMAFLDIFKAGTHQAMVNNAAASALGKMLIRVCKRYNIPLINIVRKEEQVQELKSIGAEYVLNSSSEDFETELRKTSNELNATLFLDAVGGKLTEIMANASPKGSKILLYAQLSEKPFCIHSRTILQNDISIEGFYMGNHSSKQGIVKTLRSINKVKSLLTEDLKSTIQAKFEITEMNQAVELYKNNMSKGKVLLKFAD